MQKLWTTQEVAEFLGIDEEDVKQFVRAGTLTGYKLGGQFLRFRPNEVEALKGTQGFRPGARRRGGSRQESWVSQLRDTLYFYDFYLVSATLLAVVVIYLIMSG